MNSGNNNSDAEVGGAVRVSALPKHMQDDARKLDVDGDGALSTREVGTALTKLNKTKKTNRNLKYAIVAFVILTAVLVGCIFAASITAARLAKDTVVADNGFAMVKGSKTNQVMKTGVALTYVDGYDIAALSNDELQQLALVIYQDGDIQFNVKGYSRGTETIMLMVEGGTITYDDNGITDATGSIRLLLEHAFGPMEGERRLFTGSWYWEQMGASNQFAFLR